MKISKTYMVILIVFLLSVSLSFGQPNGKAKFKPGDQTIAEIAGSDPDNFSTLVAALLCTDLVGAVADPEAELTVFAPTNLAFAELGLNAGNICDLIDEETLTTILLYHVVGERRPSPSVIRGRNKMIEMLAGGFIYPEGRGSTVVFDNQGNPRTIVIPDVMASNGIIHVINGVLLP
jgi:transforming growth factor-beta-induced protein